MIYLENLHKIWYVIFPALLPLNINAQEDASQKLAFLFFLSNIVSFLQIKTTIHINKLFYKWKTEMEL